MKRKKNRDNEELLIAINNRRQSIVLEIYSVDFFISNSIHIYVYLPLFRQFSHFLFIGTINSRDTKFGKKTMGKVLGADNKRRNRIRVR